MRKNPILIFTLIILTLTLSAVFYIQSAHFARIVKRIATKYLPENIGIRGDFEHLEVKLIPPGLAVVQPQISATGINPAGIPVGSEISAERLELIFRPFQIISGRIRVHEVRVIKGSIVTSLKPAPEKKRSKLSWEELFQIQADRLTLENTRVQLSLPEQKIDMNFTARKLELAKLQDENRTYYDLFLYVDTLRAAVPSTWQYPNQLDSLRTSLELDQDGVRLKDLEIVRDGTQFLASGSVKGDLLSGKDLRADLKLRLSADLQRMLQFLTRGSKEQELPTGHVTFDGAVKGNLDRPQETIQASGILTGENVGFSKYLFEQVHLEGAYSARSDGSAIQVKKAVLQSSPLQKVGGSQAGQGGRVEIGAFEFSPEKPQPIQTHVTFTQAHIHWLSAIILKDLYSLDGRISGDAQVQFTPPAKAGESFNVDADLDWKVTEFQLDNQRLGEKKSLNRLLVIPELNLKGKIRVRKDELAFLEPQVSIQKSQLKIGGRIRFLKQVIYEIEAGGPVDLSEIKLLAENTVRGTGMLGVQVTGPADRVMLDFDGDIRDMYYLRLHFGDFRGRISWEDAVNALHFRELDCNKGRTRYRLAGKMNLGVEEDMDIRASISSGNISEFNSIFSELTSDFWWYPARVSGAMSGTVRVHGGVSMDEMKIDAAIDGQNWDYYTERVSRVNLRGGYDRGKFFLSDFNLRKRNGTVSGRISYDANDVISWNVVSDQLSVTDFDHIARLETPIRGRILAKSQGVGPPGKVQSLTEIQVLDTMIRGRRIPSSELVIQSSRGIAKVEGQVAGGQGKLEMEYDFTDGAPSFVRLEAKSLDFTPGILLLNPSLIQDDQLQGTVSGKYELNFLTGKAEHGSGSAHLTEYRLSRQGVQFGLEKPVSFRIEDGSFLVSNASIVGPTGKVSMTLRSNRGRLSGDLRGRMDLALAEFITPLISSARGYANLGYTFSGTLKKPEISGAAALKEGLVKTPSLESPFENVQGRLELDSGVLRVVDLQSDLAGGRALGEGTIEFFVDRFPKLDVDLTLSGNKLKVYPFQVAKVRGKLTAKGETLPYLVTGRILVESAISREKISSARGPGLRSAQYTPPPRMNVATDYPLFKLDIAVSAPGNVIVQNEVLDVEAKGELRIVNTLENPRPIGDAYAVQGRVLFKDRAFVIQSGRMEFDNPTTINPRFEVVGTTEVSNRKIQMVASGRLDNSLRIEFSSSPPMPENEILSLLALGVTNEDAKRMRSADRSAYQQGEAASLVLHSLDFNREVQNKTGFQIGIDEAVDEQTGQSIFRRNSDPEANAAAPKIVIRRRFGDRIDLSVGSTIGVGSSVQREVNAEVKVTRGFSVLGVWDTFEGTGNNETRRSSYGVDLKLQKRFK